MDVHVWMERPTAFAPASLRDYLASCSCPRRSGPAAPACTCSLEQHGTAAEPRQAGTPIRQGRRTTPRAHDDSNQRPGERPGNWINVSDFGLVADALGIIVSFLRPSSL